MPPRDFASGRNPSGGNTATTTTTTTTSATTVCETMFTVGESEAISHANGTEQQTQEHGIQQLALNPCRGRFDTEKSS